MDAEIDIDFFSFPFLINTSNRSLRRERRTDHRCGRISPLEMSELVRVRCPPIGTALHQSQLSSTSMGIDDDDDDSAATHGAARPSLILLSSLSLGSSFSLSYSFIHSLLPLLLLCFSHRPRVSVRRKDAWYAENHVSSRWRTTMLARVSVRVSFIRCASPG